MEYILAHGGTIVCFACSKYRNVYYCKNLKLFIIFKNNFKKNKIMNNLKYFYKYELIKKYKIQNICFQLK